MFKYFKQLHSSNKSHKLPITHCLSDQATVPQKAREFKQVQSLCLNLPKLARQRHSKGEMEKFALLIFLLQALEHSLFYTRMKILSSLVACLNASTCQVNCDSCLLHLPRDLKHMDFLLQSLHIWVQSVIFFLVLFSCLLKINSQHLQELLQLYSNPHHHVQRKNFCFASPTTSDLLFCNKQRDTHILLFFTHGFQNLSPCLSLPVPLLITEISQCIWYLLLEK